MFDFLESIEAHTLDGVMPQDQKQYDQLWFLREEVANACIKYGYCLKYDVSLPSEAYYELVNAT